MTRIPIVNGKPFRVRHTMAERATRERFGAPATNASLTASRSSGNSVHFASCPRDVAFQLRVFRPVDLAL